MTEWWTTKEGLYDRAWQTVSDAVTDRTGAALQPVLATVSKDGWPEARTVVLRRADMAEQILEVYTDSQSDKIASLGQTPRAVLHIWDAEQNLQLRFRADVTLLQGNAVHSRWDALPGTGRLSYGVMPPPGTVIPQDLSYQKTPDQSRFCILQLKVIHLDIVHLGAQHRRATYGSGTAGDWRVP